LFLFEMYYKPSGPPGLTACSSVHPHPVLCLHPDRTSQTQPQSQLPHSHGCKQENMKWAPTNLLTMVL